MTADPAPFRQRRRFLIYTGVLLGIAALLVVALGIHQARTTREALQRARDRIAVSGAPTSVEDLRAGGATGAGATVAWLDGFETLGAGWTEELLHDADSLRARLAVVRGEGGAPTELADLTALLECLDGSEGDATRELLEALGKPGDEVPAFGPLDNCKRLAIRVTRAVSAPLLERALESGELAPLNAAHLLASVERGSAVWSFPDVRTLTYLHLVETLTRAAMLSVADGDDAEAVRRLELAFHAAGLMADLPWLLPNRLWEAGEKKCLATLKTILPWLPPETDLSGIETYLEHLDPHRRLVDAVRGERVLALDLFAGLREEGSASWTPSGGGAGAPEVPALPSLWRHRALDAGELEYLESMERALAALERGGPEGIQALEELQQRLRAEEGLGLYMVPNLANMLRSTEELEAARRSALERR